MRLDYDDKDTLELLKELYSELELKSEELKIKHLAGLVKILHAADGSIMHCRNRMERDAVDILLRAYVKGDNKLDRDVKLPSDLYRRNSASTNILDECKTFENTALSEAYDKGTRGRIYKQLFAQRGLIPKPLDKVIGDMSWLLKDPRLLVRILMVFNVGNIVEMEEGDD